MKTGRSPDVASIDAIIRALYESVSFSPGGQPDYDRLRSLFHPGARLIPVSGDKDASVAVLDVETLIIKSREYVVLAGQERMGFVEKEITRRVDAFGRIVHVFSTYESHNGTADPGPVQRGINSIQLVKDDDRWLVLTILWDVEKPTDLIPPTYLPTEKS